MDDETHQRYQRTLSAPGVVWGISSRIDLQQIANNDTLILELDNERVVLHLTYCNKEMNYTYSHYSSPAGDDADLSILQDFVQGDIKTASGLYYLTSISKDYVSIVKYESDIPEEREPMNSSDTEDSEEEDLTEMASVVPTTTPVIRVLFLYTNSALNLVGSGYQNEVAMRTVVYTYINRANLSFSNSNINAHMALAYLGPTSFNEASHSWDDVLDYFTTPNDGYIDEVHTLRNKYSADVCVLFINKSDYCGEAEAIKADDDEAFCIVHPTYGCNAKYTAIHEIGHLVGCRHNYGVDVNLIPYRYGHGYYYYVENNPNASWRTMMAYENGCETGCQRILYWSNPDVYYQGNPTGTSGIANNARVWNNRASTVSDFRAKDNFILLTSSSNNTTALYQSYETITSMATGGGYEVQSGQVMDLAAGEEIRITSNTHIKYGSIFRASIRNNADGSNYPQFIRAKLENDVTIKEKQSRLSISPNPVHETLTVITNEELKFIELYNVNGQCVLQTKALEINVAHLPTGMYILRAKTKDGRVMQSKFIKQ
ncbi:MAG: zinc-dependent metalloprotease [Paludibacteraceae bacterium]|nr:zinc-dependent metalloprotease [Paludibacteraceae bacterium]